MQETKLVKSSHITFESEATMLDIVGKLNAVELSGNEDEPSKEEETTQIGGFDGSDGQKHRTRHHQNAPLRIAGFATPVDWRNGPG